MTGRELFEQEMKARGFTKAQIHSKIVAVCLDTLANYGVDRWYRTWEIDNEISEKESIIKDLNSKLARLEQDVEYASSQLNNIQKNISEEIKKKSEYLEGLIEKIENCGDQETKNTIALMQTFHQAIDIDTKYDNTAFIAGCAAILSKGKIDALTEFKKINPKISSVAGTQDWRGIMI